MCGIRPSLGRGVDLSGGGGRFGDGIFSGVVEYFFRD